MRGQVLVDCNYLKEQHHIYRYSIVDIIEVRKSKKYGHVLWYRATYKGRKPLYYRYNELNILTH